MAVTLADAYVRIRPDSKEFGPDMQREMQKPAQDAGEATGNAWGKAFSVAAKAAVAGAVILAGVAIRGMIEATNQARDLNETISKTGVVFGKSADAITQWASTAATKFGQSNQVALDGANTFALYGKAAGKSGQSLVDFSTKMTELASDVASFSNANPADVIADFGAAMRGEFDPIEKYGILLNESVVKQEALRLGLIKTTTQALTPQQRVLAVQAAILKQTKDAQGDFARTSNSLANQQRILTANMDNLTASIGQAFLPVATKFVTMINQKVIPNLQEIWKTHGPKITAWLGEASEKFANWLSEFDADKAGEMFNKAGDALQKLLPHLDKLKEGGGESLADTWKVTGVVMGFLAEHADKLGAALPYLAAGFILVKTATVAANVATAVSPITQTAAALANNRLAASLAAQTAALNANKAATVAGTAATTTATAAENVGFFAKVRSTAATVASTVASGAARVATLAWAGVQWVLNAALTANPIGIVVVALAAFVAAVIWAYKNVDWFREFIDNAWKVIVLVTKWAWDNVIMPIFRAVVWYINNVMIPVYKFLWENVIKPVFTFIGDFISWVWTNRIKPAWDLLISFLRNVLNPAILWLWNNVIKPTFGFIGDFIVWVWKERIKPTWDFLVRTVTETIPNAFKRGVEFIANAWNGLQEVAKKPVRFVVETVINRGIIGTFNTVAGWFGQKGLGTVSLPAGFGDGPGYGGGHNHGPAGPQTGDGLGDLFRGPAQFVASRVGLDDIKAKFGNNPFTGLLTGAGGKLKDMLLEKVKDMMSFWDGPDAGGGRGANGLAAGITAVLGALRATFGNVPVISGLRPGDRTLSGRISYHSSGRAIDIAPNYVWARFLNAVFGPRLRELITPWNELNIHNGRPHRYTGAVWNQHNFAGGNAHIHAAMDSGGYLLPGWNIVPNWTGRPEPVTTAASMDRMAELLMMLLAAVRALSREIGREITGGVVAARTQARRV